MMNDNGERDLSRLPLIVHVIYRFDYGGLENGLVNIINTTQGTSFRHCVVALTESTDFKRRVRAPGVSIYTLGKRPGKDPAAYGRLFRLLRKLRPAVLHTRNIGTLDCAILGRIAGVPICVHGEHGWDMHDPDGTSRKYRWLRRLAAPFIQHFVTVSIELQDWLINFVGIPSAKVIRICNGVDTNRFFPPSTRACHPEVATRFSENACIVGSVLRFEVIKDPLNLVRAFISIRHRAAERDPELGLVMVGDGPLIEPARKALEEAGLANAAWLPGSRDDVPELMRSFDLFVLGSRREGISNTLLEAMACGLPVIASDTGGNRELVVPDTTGSLVPPGDSEALAAEVLVFARDPQLRRHCGHNARHLATSTYSLDTMTSRYQHVYEEAIAGLTGQ